MKLNNSLEAGRFGKHFIQLVEVLIFEKSTKETSRKKVFQDRSDFSEAFQLLVKHKLIEKISIPIYSKKEKFQ